MKPFVKWAGGKRQILNYIRKFIDNSHDENEPFRYIEPFVGGGAVFFDLMPNTAVISDLNEDLINAYNVIKSSYYKELINKLNEFNEKYKKGPDEFYYDMRAIDRQDNWIDKYDNVYRAARMIFLNKTCFNGLYRVNNKGQFNTPIGRYNNPLICDEANLIEVHNYLSNNQIEINHCSYENTMKIAKAGDIIYLDPPYDYEDDDGFTKYQMNGFTFEDFRKLKECCDKALEKGAYVIISNNATNRVLELFDDPNYSVVYDMNHLSTKRMINCNANERNTGKEVVIWGIPCIFPQANSLDKIIKLIMSNNDALRDRDIAKQILDVTSDRQVSYYYSSLIYIGLVRSNKDLNDETLLVKNNETELKKLIIYKLLKKDLFISLMNKYPFDSNEQEFIIEEIKKYYPKLTDDTIKRRASTIKSWIEWIYNNSQNIYQLN